MFAKPPLQKWETYRLEFASSFHKKDKYLHLCYIKVRLFFQTIYDESIIESRQLRNYTAIAVSSKTLLLVFVIVSINSCSMLSSLNVNRASCVIKLLYGVALYI